MGLHQQIQVLAFKLLIPVLAIPGLPLEDHLLQEQVQVSVQHIIQVVFTKYVLQQWAVMNHGVDQQQIVEIIQWMHHVALVVEAIVLLVQ